MSVPLSLHLHPKVVFPIVTLVFPFTVAMAIDALSIATIRIFILLISFRCQIAPINNLIQSVVIVRGSDPVSARSRLNTTACELAMVVLAHDLLWRAHECYTVERFVEKFIRCTRA
ncbi:hypothetical protein F5141DRAFT_220271 [Pisolithus sp. B1]|nr:hypothetical protein F5141DRAFT_220271 [Pisolithus sp. B1]